MRDRCIALLVVLSMLTGATYATIHHVDDDAPGDPLARDPNTSDPLEDGSVEHPFDGIQEAIDAAMDGDTIIVAPGHYLSPDTWAYDEIKFKDKNIRLVSSAPTDFSVIEETILCGVVVFQGREDPNCLLQGFKIQNHGHGGILGNYTRATISHCIISGNGPCGATVLKDVLGRVSNCLIADNTTFHSCGVMPVVSGCIELVNCTIANNISGVSIPGYATQPPIRNCVIYGNQGLLTITGAVNRGISLASYSLVEGGAGETTTRMIDADPRFVEWGFWTEVRTTSTVTRRGSGEPVSRSTMSRGILTEGDYHLKTEGWRWSPQAVHGSHWYFDTSTSPAVDAGRPMDGLGEEPERAADDPNGIWGYNRGVDLGAYGGTTQGAIGPNRGPAPGAGAVDLRDYWPFAVNNLWQVHNPEGGSVRHLRVQLHLMVNGFPVYALWAYNAPTWATNSYCVYVDQTLYATQDTASLNLLPDTSSQFQPQYPQYLVVGSTITVPFDPFVKRTSQYLSAVVVRGSLEELLAGTDLDPTLFVEASWPDVIALRTQTADGTPGELITMFARGFGPLMVGGQPVEQATVDGVSFRAVNIPIPTRR